MKTLPFTIVYPPGGAVIKNGLPGIFIYGAAKPGGKLKINGKRVAIYRTGAYLAYIPAKQGSFDINFEMGGARHTHNVFIEKPAPKTRKKAVWLKPPKAYKKPQFETTKTAPLKNVKIFLDPGHSPRPTYAGEGKTSPLGVGEYKINYRTALAARKALAALGAKAMISKKPGEQMLLLPRSERALAWGADIFISLHNNSWPDNVNPFKRKNGFGVYYYYPHSLPLARAVERAYRKNIPLPSEGIKRADFSVLRNTPQIPAVLIESAYITLPKHEELLLQKSFIDKLAKAIAQGALGFVKQ